MQNNKLRRTGKRIKGVLEFCLYPFFVARGKKPHRLGYNFYKRRVITRAIRKGTLQKPELRPGYGLHLDERVVEYPWLFARLPKSSGKLLDAGSVLNAGYILKQRRLLNKQIYITTLAPELTCYWYRNVSYLFGDLRDTCFRDGFFDTIVSLSTIEHIGLDNTQLYSRDARDRENDADGYLAAIREYRRIVKKGGRLFISVPFGRYRNHGWFQVFDARMVDRLQAEFKPRECATDYFKYDAGGWHRAGRDELKEATFFDIHARRDYDEDFAAGARGLACMEFVK